MKVLSSLIKVRVSQLLSSMLGVKGKKGKERGIGGKILMGVLWTYVCVVFVGMFAAMFFGMAVAYHALELDWLYFTMYGIIAFALMFVGSVFITQSQLFEAKDNELLLSMPISPAYILLSRVAMIYLLNIFYEALVGVPAIVCYAIVANVTFLSVISFVLLFVTLPLLSLSVASVFAFLLARLTSRMKNKTMLQMVISLGALVLYMMCYSKIGDYITSLTENGEHIAQALGVISPLYLLGASVGNGNLLYALLVSVFFIALFSLVYYLLSVGFTSTVIRNSGEAKKKYVRKVVKNRGARSALVRRELMRFSSSAAYMMNCGLGLLISLVIAVMLVLKKGDLLDLTEQLGVPASFVLPFFAVALSVAHTMTLISAPSISLEGENLWISKSLPVSGSDILLSKITAHLKIAVPFTVVSSLVVVIGYGMDIVCAALTLIVPCVMCVFTAVIGTYIGVKFAKFDWTDETVAIKQSSAVAITMGISFGAILAFAVLYFALLIKYISPLVMVIIFAVCIALVSFLVYNKIRKRGNIYFSALDS